MAPSIRRAVLEDVETLLDLRLALQRESGHIAGDTAIEAVRQATRQYLTTRLPTGEFIVWVAEVEGKIVGTSGLIFFTKPPTPTNLSGMEAYILNMYTIPEWRGKGIATMLLQKIIDFVKETEARRIFMYATRDGKSLYEKAGFVAKKRHTLEMELVW